jgi:hypothetical protein
MAHPCFEMPPAATWQHDTTPLCACVSLSLAERTCILSRSTASSRLPAAPDDCTSRWNPTANSDTVHATESHAQCPSASAHSPTSISCSERPMSATAVSLLSTPPTATVTRAFFAAAVSLRARAYTHLRVGVQGEGGYTCLLRCRSRNTPRAGPSTLSRKWGKYLEEGRAVKGHAADGAPGWACGYAHQPVTPSRWREGGRVGEGWYVGLAGVALKTLSVEESRRSTK